MGRKVIQLNGQTFGRLTVVGYGGRGDHCTWWECRCDCGKKIMVRSHALRSGKHRSCGCINPNLTHGDTKGGRSREYVAWLNMRQRCGDPQSTAYERYGGRGIKVCDRWQDSFENFLADMGRKPGRGYSIDRRDNNGNYDPGNCYWATPTEQRRNMSSNFSVTVKGQRMSLVAACETLGLKYQNVRARIYRGKTFEEACY